MEASSSSEKAPDLRLIGPEDATEETDTPATPPAGMSELVSEVIRESGLLAPDKVDQVRKRAGTGAFADALVEEGFASSLGVARSLAEQYRLPLVDLAIAGVDAQAAKLIPLPVLERGFNAYR